MNKVEEEQLKMEIAHIFDSGAKELRILEMVKSFYKRPKQEDSLPNITRSFLLKMCEKYDIQPSKLLVKMQYGKIIVLQSYDDEDNPKLKAIEVIEF